MTVTDAYNYSAEEAMIIIWKKHENAQRDFWHSEIKIYLKRAHVWIQIWSDATANSWNTVMKHSLECLFFIDIKWWNWTTGAFSKQFMAFGE